MGFGKHRAQGLPHRWPLQQLLILGLPHPKAPTPAEAAPQARAFPSNTYFPFPSSLHG